MLRSLVQTLRRFTVPTVVPLLFAALVATSSEGLVQKPLPGRMGQVVDWSSRHVQYPRGTSLRALALSERDPRAYWNYLNLLRAANEAQNLPRPVHGRPGPSPEFRPDWSVSLGAAGAAADMYPAKYSFNVNATPSCANDFVVFPINVNGTAAQATIAAFNNLYSGTSSTSCGTDTAATILWAYRPATTGTTRTRTSPIISLDGTKVAFLDGNSPAIFHVLTPVAGQGTVTAPVVPTTQMVSVTLTGGTADTNSPPFMDYYNDFAYVGTDNGMLFKITGVFKGTPALAGAPWPLTAGATTLTGPVVDFDTGNIFVGSANGDLYGFTSGGTAITGSPLAIGSGRADGGIDDPPVVDVVNGLLYVSTGDNAALGGHARESTALVVQASTSSFSTVQVASIGTTEVVPIHAGALNAAYFSGNANGIGTTTAWFFYVCGVATGGGRTPELYRVGFTGSPPKMNTTVDATSVALSANNGEACSPLTEFQNGVDRIFLGLMTAAEVEFFDISTTTTPTLGGTGGVAPVAEAGGTSGIIVDNVSNIAQASSIYFTTQANSANCGTHRCGVKLTQSTLQ